jgi:hypothetical protein
MNEMKKNNLEQVMLTLNLFSPNFLLALVISPQLKDAP